MSTDEERTESEVVDIVIDDDEPAAEETTAKTEEKPEEAKPDEHSGVYVDQKAFTRAAKRHKFLKVLTISLARLRTAGDRREEGRL